MQEEEEAMNRKHSARGMRILRSREPQLIENTKKVLVMKGQNTSETIKDVLKDIARLTKPNCITFNRKNEIYPFEDANSVEFLTQKNDCSLIAIGSHSKKRPNNLVLGRTYDGHVLDLVEFGVESSQALDEVTSAKKLVGAKPLFLFVGSQWETDSLFTRIQTLLLDFFRGVKLEMINLKGIDHVYLCSIEDSKIFVRLYNITFVKSGTRVPNVKLTYSGPSLDLVVRRQQLASDDMWKTAIKRPSAAVTAKIKNIGRNDMGDKVGRIHMERQNLDKMNSRRATALRGERHKKRGSGDSDAPIQEIGEEVSHRKVKRSRSN